MKLKHLELFFWMGGLAILACLNPADPPAFSLCPVHYLGLPCPGCGLGRSLAYLFRGHLYASFLTHPLGLPAAIILGWRIWHLFREWIKPNKSVPVKS